MVERVDEAIHRVLADEPEGIGLDEVDEVLLVGGSTLLPGVYTRVEEMFGRSRVRAWEPFEAVALGDDIWVVAFPWGRRRTVVTGVVSQIAWDEPLGPNAPIVGRDVFLRVTDRDSVPRRRTGAGDARQEPQVASSLGLILIWVVIVVV